MQSGLCKQQLLFVMFLAKTKQVSKILQIDVTLGGVRPGINPDVNTALNRDRNPCVHDCEHREFRQLPVAQPTSLIQPGSSREEEKRSAGSQTGSGVLCGPTSHIQQCLLEWALGHELKSTISTSLLNTEHGLHSERRKAGPCNLFCKEQLCQSL